MTSSWFFLIVLFLILLLVLPSWFFSFLFLIHLPIFLFIISLSSSSWFFFSLIFLVLDFLLFDFLFSLLILILLVLDVLVFDSSAILALCLSQVFVCVYKCFFLLFIFFIYLWKSGTNIGNVCVRSHWPYSKCFRFLACFMCALCATKVKDFRDSWFWENPSASAIVESFAGNRSTDLWCN